MLIPYFPKILLPIKLIGFIGIICLLSCNKEAIIPFAGTYVGDSENPKWDYNEILDSDGNMIGIEATADTLYSQKDMFIITPGKKDQFTISGSGTLVRLSSFSDHQFTYDGENAYSIIEESDGSRSKRLEFSFDGSGGVTVYYIEDNVSASRPPVGQEIFFSGIKQ